MSKKMLCLFAGSCVFTLIAFGAVPSSAQASAVKEKPAMYTYVADWQIPRAHWADVAKSNAADKPILDKALADGSIIGYGNDEVMVHQQNGSTHDNWWSSMSMAGLMKVLDAFYASGSTTTDADAVATQHSDNIFESHYYNWHSGAYKNGYTEVSVYKLKADAPEDAIDTLSKNLVAPLLEKLFADGTIVEYEIDTLALHSEAPGGFWIAYIAAKPEGLDKVNAAVTEVLKASPLSGPAFDSMTDAASHRDELLRGDGMYK
jgi:hypothetical protein